MNNQTADAQQSRATEATNHDKYGENFQVIKHVAPAVFVGRGLADLGRPRDQHATRDPRKQVIEVICTYHAKNAKIHPGLSDNRRVYGTTGRAPEPITHGKTLVFPGAIKTDATLIACFQLGNFRTTHNARVIIRAISGCTPEIATAKVANTRYTDPPTNQDAPLVPSYAHDHCQTSLIITAAQMINLRVRVFDVQSDSAGSCAAATTGLRTYKGMA